MSVWSQDSPEHATPSARPLLHRTILPPDEAGAAAEKRATDVIAQGSGFFTDFISVESHSRPTDPDCGAPVLRLGCLGCGTLLL